MGMLISLIIWGTVFGTLAGLVTNSKGRGWGEGIVLGALLGIIGLIITAFLKPVSSSAPPRVTSGAPQPGWYQDGQRGLRWWNGSQWTPNGASEPIYGGDHEVVAFPEPACAFRPAGLVATGVSGCGVGEHPVGRDARSCDGVVLLVEKVSA